MFSQETEPMVYDNLLLSFQMSDVIILSMVTAIKMNGVSCCMIGNVERLPRSEMDGHGGMLRLRILARS